MAGIHQAPATLESAAGAYLYCLDCHVIVPGTREGTEQFLFGAHTNHRYAPLRALPATGAEDSSTTVEVSSGAHHHRYSKRPAAAAAPSLHAASAADQQNGRSLGTDGSNNNKVKKQKVMENAAQWALPLSELRSDAKAFQQCVDSALRSLDAAAALSSARYADISAQIAELEAARAALLSAGGIGAEEAAALGRVGALEVVGAALCDNVEKIAEACAFGGRGPFDQRPFVVSSYGSRNGAAAAATADGGGRSDGVDDEVEAVAKALRQSVRRLRHLGYSSSDMNSAEKTEVSYVGPNPRHTANRHRHAGGAAVGEIGSGPSAANSLLHSATAASDLTARATNAATADNIMRGNAAAAEQSTHRGDGTGAGGAGTSDGRRQRHRRSGTSSSTRKPSSWRSGGGRGGADDGLMASHTTTADDEEIVRRGHSHRIRFDEDPASAIPADDSSSSSSSSYSVSAPSYAGSAASGASSSLSSASRFHQQQLRRQQQQRRHENRRSIEDDGEAEAAAAVCMAVRHRRGPSATSFAGSAVTMGSAATTAGGDQRGHGRCNRCGCPKQSPPPPLPPNSRLPQQQQQQQQLRAFITEVAPDVSLRRQFEGLAELLSYQMLVGGGGMSTNLSNGILSTPPPNPPSPPPIDTACPHATLSLIRRVLREARRIGDDGLYAEGTRHRAVKAAVRLFASE